MTSSEPDAQAPTTLRCAGQLRGEGLRVALACSRFNDLITERLVSGARDGLVRPGVDPGSITEAWAPGAFELPLVAQQLAGSGAFDAVICLGAVIRGATGHYDLVAGQCAAGIQRVQLDTSVPVGFGVLTTETIEQAQLFEGYLDNIRKRGSSVGAVIEVVAEGVPAGLGAPVYGKLDGDLAAALLGINAVKGVELGAGFAAAALSGEENADEMRMGNDGKPIFLSNQAGGILGGLPTVQPIVCRFARKPPASILPPLPTVHRDGPHP